MKNKFGYTVLCIFLATLSLSIGANGNQEAKATQDSSINGSESLSPHAITSEPLTLSIFLHYWNSRIFTNQPVFQEAAKETNIFLEGAASKVASNSNEVYNMMMASGELADIIHTGRTQLIKHAAEGAFLPLDDLIDQHAPNIKSFLAERPNIASYLKAADGNTYYIPFFPDGDPAMGWFVRQDWLDKLGLERPNNVDELYTVLKAFKEQDPNGNGKADEIPFYQRSKDNGFLFMLPLFGISIKDRAVDGQYMYGYYSPELKTAIQTLSKWYDEGLIDQEIFTRGNKARQIMFDTNNGGMTIDWFGSTSQYQATYEEKIEGLDWQPMAPPADIYGTRWIDSYRNKVNDHGWGISVKNEHPVETIKYFDFWFTEKGRRIANFGVEGETYQMVNGKPIFTDLILKDSNPTAKIMSYGCQLEFGYQQDFNYEKQVLNEVASKGIAEYQENGYPMEAFPKLSYTVEEEDWISNNKTSIETYIREKVQRWLLGGEECDDASFDEYIRTLKNMGIDKFMEIQQAAYERAING